MGLIFTSLLSIIIFAALAVLILNYAIYSWENKKVNDLASRIKPATSDNILQKSNVSRSFTSLDLGSTMSKNKVLQVAGNIYDRAIINITNKEYPDWMIKFITEFENFRKNAWKSLVRFIKYLISLTKPVNKENLHGFTQTDLKSDKEVKDVQKVVDKIVETNSEDTAANLNLLTTEDLNQQASNPEVKNNPNIPIFNSPAVTLNQAKSASKPQGVATLNLASSDEKSEKDMTMFEKLESRILEKLNSSGLHHYDIWLDLGNLYEKYNESDKAKEVYSLVLKHSTSKEKDIARDKLIGLS